MLCRSDALRLASKQFRLESTPWPTLKHLTPQPRMPQSTSSTMLMRRNPRYVLLSSRLTRLLTRNQEIMLMKQRVEEMEREAKKLRELQAAAEASAGAEGSEGHGETEDDKAASDQRSIYIGNVCPNQAPGFTQLTKPYARSTTPRHPKRFKPISRLVAPLTESPFSATSSPVTPKGSYTLVVSTALFILDPLLSVMPTLNLPSPSTSMLL